MRKILMFGTMLGVASAALAFGGMFNHGNKSTTYKGGVDAIGVHFGGKNTNTPEEEPCPEERQCNNVCCGEDHICNEGRCCFQPSWSDEPICCEASSSTGYSTQTGSCCSINEKTFVSWYEFWGYAETSCCEGSVFTTGSEEDHYSKSCCNENLKKVYGPVDWETEGEYYICGNCIKNEDCHQGYYCHLTGESCYHPAFGSCEEIGLSTSATITNLGHVIKSNSLMSWWSAQNWCIAQGLQPIDSEAFTDDVLLNLEQQFGVIDLWTASRESSWCGARYACFWLNPRGISIEDLNHEAAALCK